jgi:FkbM family methyltransferase
MSIWPSRRSPAPWTLPFPETCTEEDIYYCFRLLLGRPPTAGEWSGHCSRVGRALPEVLAGYLSSREFKNRDLFGVLEADHVLINLPDFDLYVSAADGAVGGPILRQRAYEPHVTAAVRAALQPGMTFLDIGANIGFFTLLAARAVGPTGRVVAVEPFQSNLKLLYLSARANRFEHVDILPFAASDRSGLLAFENVDSNGRIFEPRAELRFLLTTTLVYGARLDDVLRDVARLDAIKIDVEGAEYRALRGTRQLLERCRPTIFSEFSPPALEVVSGVDATTYLQLLLIDQHYGLETLNFDGTVTACGRDCARVIRAFEQSGVDHIDIVARPSA